MKWCRCKISYKQSYKIPQITSIRIPIFLTCIATIFNHGLPPLRRFDVQFFVFNIFILYNNFQFFSQFLWIFPCIRRFDLSGGNKRWGTKSANSGDKSVLHNYKIKFVGVNLWNYRTDFKKCQNALLQHRQCCQIRDFEPPGEFWGDR